MQLLAFLVPVQPSPFVERAIVPNAALLAAPLVLKAPEPSFRDRTAWWPAMVWLSGFALLASWSAVARILFLLFLLRRQRLDSQASR